MPDIKVEGDWRIQKDIVSLVKFESIRVKSLQFSDHNASSVLADHERYGAKLGLEQSGPREHKRCHTLDTLSTSQRAISSL